MNLPKVLVVLGLGIALLGVLIGLAQRLGIGRLPGDFVWRGSRVTVSFPLASSLILSLLLTLLLNWWAGRSR